MKKALLLLFLVIALPVSVFAKPTIMDEMNDQPKSKSIIQSLSIISPLPYDAKNNSNLILAPQPIRIQYKGNKTIKEASYSIDGSKKNYLNSSIDGIWETNIDWSKISTGEVLTLEIVIWFTDGSILISEEPIKISGYYPNKSTDVYCEDQYLNGALLNNTVNLNFSFKDDNNDVVNAEILIDGVRRYGKKFAKAANGHISYNWNTDKEKAGTHTVRFLTEDRFGRKQTTPIYDVVITP